MGHLVLVDLIGIKLKPTAVYGEKAARLRQIFIERGVSLSQTGPLIQQRAALRCQRGNAFCAKHGISPEYGQGLALGVNKLDADELEKAILQASFLLVADDDSLRNGDKKFPNFVAFWDGVAHFPCQARGRDSG